MARLRFASALRATFISSEQPDHAKMLTADVLGDRAAGVGSGSTKQMAEQMAEQIAARGAGERRRREALARGAGESGGVHPAFVLLAL
jgi:hypothetical protein